MHLLRLHQNKKEIKKEIGIDKIDGAKISTKVDGSAKKLMDENAAASAA